MHTSLAGLLRSDRLLVGTWCQLPSPDVVELAAGAGFDFLVIDREHGRYSLALLADVLRATDKYRVPALVRVAGADVAVEVGAALDAGAAGVIVPHVGSPDEARAVVEAARFRPDGTRGASPGVRAWWGWDGDWREFARSENEGVTVGVMLEGPAALDDATAILNTKGLGLAFVGPMDLSSAMGVPGELENPRLLRAIADIAAIARSCGVRLGAWSPDAATAEPWTHVGVDVVAMSSDALVLHDAWRALRDSADKLRQQ